MKQNWKVLEKNFYNWKESFQNKSIKMAKKSLMVAVPGSSRRARRRCDLLEVFRGEVPPPPPLLPRGALRCCCERAAVGGLGRSLTAPSCAHNCEVPWRPSPWGSSLTPSSPSSLLGGARRAACHRASSRRGRWGGIMEDGWRERGRGEEMMVRPRVVCVGAAVACDVDREFGLVWLSVISSYQHCVVLWA
jgi:hypothetical protein